MINLKSKLCLLGAFLCVVIAQAGPQKNDISTWPKSTSAEFGCFLEKQFGHKDEKFNCALKKYVNKGHPCFSTEEYYEGPQISNQVAQKINSKIVSVDLVWEKGRMQSLAFTLDAKYSEKEIRKLFKLPKKIHINDCSAKNSCVTITGFETLGTGVAECGDE